ncbi:hypothetical protein NDU88_003998 [Pleurodeles waltl]|uniref:Uncharacterized protein n=1 Tax=Pleurodeles waltl TaxID=8319 RepID=A0AAV7QH67_PLEWA|nr:hypothetical protein NDU88_003998 [Pleurodeles waltl]
MTCRGGSESPAWAQLGRRGLRKFVWRIDSDPSAAAGQLNPCACNKWPEAAGCTQKNVPKNSRSSQALHCYPRQPWLRQN